MDNKKDKIKEPYSPEQTPNPPQVIDPNRMNEQGEKQRPVENKQGAANRADPKNENQSNRKDADKDQNKKGEKLLGESETEIDDEATI